jgi:hypothetical protein
MTSQLSRTMQEAEGKAQNFAQASGNGTERLREAH